MMRRFEALTFCCRVVPGERDQSRTPALAHELPTVGSCANPPAEDITWGEPVQTPPHLGRNFAPRFLSALCETCALEALVARLLLEWCDLPQGESGVDRPIVLFTGREKPLVIHVIGGCCV